MYLCYVVFSQRVSNIYLLLRSKNHLALAPPLDLFSFVVPTKRVELTVLALLLFSCTPCYILLLINTCNDDRVCGTPYIATLLRPNPRMEWNGQYEASLLLNHNMKWGYVTPNRP